MFAFKKNYFLIIENIKDFDLKNIKKKINSQLFIGIYITKKISVISKNLGIYVKRKKSNFLLQTTLIY